MVRIHGFSLIGFLGSSIKAISEFSSIAEKVSKAESIPKAVSDAGSNLVNSKININPLTLFSGSELTVAKNEIKDITEVIRSLENRGILLKRTTRKIGSKKGGFLNVLRPLMLVGLPLVKNVLTPLAKSILAPLRLTTTTSATDAAV